MRKIITRVCAMLAALLLAVSMLPMAALKVQAADGPIIKLHYHRADGNYSGWDVWLWEYGKDGAGYAFTNEGGEMVATMNVTPGVTQVGFIVRTEGWGQKDVGEDQFIDIADVVEGTVHVYIESGIKGYTRSIGEDAKVGIKVRTAKYDMDGFILVELTGTPEDFSKDMFKLTGPDGEIEIAAATAKDGNIYELKLNSELDLYSAYSIEFDDNKYSVTMPVLFSTQQFEDKFTYTGTDLGANWSKDSTFFRVWAPTATEMYVNLYESGNEGETDLIKSVQMTQAEQGTWTVTVGGDLNGTYYTYTVTVNGSEAETIDPYARTAGANGKRGMIIDLDSTDPDGWENDRNPHAGEKINDAIIYEGHIRDLTINSEANVVSKGKYLGLAETGTRTGSGVATALDHMVELGITHLHILPMYDFGSVDETSAINRYNWGYDPVNYNIPEGSYATDANNGEVRVAEVKQMVQALHNNGISVVMDVVYNHVYSAKEFSVNVLVPGYFSRVTENGSYSNGSGCGNDTATERSMVRKFIVDSVNYWADEYHIDGFRFDLVGLMDTETINEIVATVHETHPDVIFYGEGWTLTTTVTKDNVELCTQPNSVHTPGFSYFNDTIRDGLKGSVFNTAAGFVSGSAGDKPKIERCILGADTWCKSPSQTINYASCHDNNTLYDRLRLSNKDASDEDIVKMNNLAAAIYMTAEGTPFMSAGEEMLRTKTNKDGTYNSNSYNAGDTVNSLKWATLSEQKYADVFEYYKGLIAFRKAHSVLRLTTAEDVAKYVSTVTNDDLGLVITSIVGGPETESAEAIYMIFNRDSEAKKVELPEGEWKIYVNGSKAGVESLKTASGEVSVEPISALILAKGVPEKTADANDGQGDAMGTDGVDGTGSGTGSGNGSDTDSTRSGRGMNTSSILLIAAAVAAISASVAVICRKKKKG